MKLKAFAFFALFALVLASGQQAGKNTEAIPRKYAKETEILLNLESRSKHSDSQVINMRLINPTYSSITFTGYSESSPLYKIQKWGKEDWVDLDVGRFDGTGLGWRVIAPGQSSIIQVAVGEKLFPLRVGVEYAGGKKTRTVWSARIERKSFSRADVGLGINIGDSQRVERILKKHGNGSKPSLEQ
ncbi:MAG: hypothetical protein KAX16_05110 [Actinomycetia bacterium]|nr:hypothetical protein [Actinomycetes bacterium]